MIKLEAAFVQPVHGVNSVEIYIVIYIKALKDQPRRQIPEIGQENVTKKTL